MKYNPFAVVLVVLVVGTLLEGKYSDRWGQAKSERLDRFTERLNEVPMVIGDWQGQDEPVDAEEFEASNCTGCVSRTYTNQEGQRVNVYLVSGSGRHVTIHTPDWCYVGAGYNMADEPQQRTIDGVEGVVSPPEFLTTIFKKEDPLYTHHIRIFWSFSEDGKWVGPRIPKPALGHRPAMYKVYLITEIDEIGADIDTNPTLDFVREFFPAINQKLFKTEDAG